MKITDGRNVYDQTAGELVHTLVKRAAHQAVGDLEELQSKVEQLTDIVAAIMDTMDEEKVKKVIESVSFYLKVVD